VPVDGFFGSRAFLTFLTFFFPQAFPVDVRPSMHGSSALATPKHPDSNSAKPLIIK
jgi:hypothetical protein